MQEERKRLGLDQEQMAEVGGVHRTAQSRYERNMRHPDAEYLAAIAGVGADVLYIVTGQRAPGLSSQEDKMLANYRALNEEDKTAVNRLTDSLAQSKRAPVKAGNGQQ